MFVHRTLPECNGKVTKPAKGHLHTFVRFRRLLHSFAFLCSLLHSFIRHANRSYERRESFIGKMSIAHRSNRPR